MCPRAVAKKNPKGKIKQPQAAKLWILLVGVNQYQDSALPSLQYSALDCQGLGEALTEATESLPAREVILNNDFVDNKPVLNTVRASLEQIVSSAQSNDTILFYFSGHGILNQKTQQVYLCLRDTQKSQLSETGLPLQEILRLLGNSQASQQLVWLDACHSGGMTLRGTTKISLPNPTTQLVQVLRQKAQQSQGFYALLSCDQTQQSWEFPELGHGVFTYYLMRGLRGEAADSQGVIEADTLYQYVYHQTLRYIDRSNQQIRLINQQKSGRGEKQLQSEYPLQTPKRIVEGFGKVVIGKRGSDHNHSLPRQALVVDGLGINETTLAVSKVLRGRGSFDLEYFPPSGKQWSDVGSAIESCLNTASVSEEETTTVLLYLRGKIKQGKAGEAWLVFKDGAYISREWLRRVLFQSPVTQQIIILDCPDGSGIEEWVEQLRLEYDRGQCILAYGRKDQEQITSNGVYHHYVQQFSTALLSTLEKSDPEAGLSVATWITQLQIELAGSNILPQIWLSGTRGVIEVLPAKSVNSSNRDDSAILDINVCPYKGLEAFTKEDAQYFYGREALVQKLVNHLHHKTTLAVVGASGSGKSSLIQAGLFNQLLQGKQLPESDRWMLKCFRPGNNPFHSLAQCLVDEGTSKVRAQQQLQIEGLLYQGVEGFVQWLRTRPEPMIVLAVDQFEELFTLAPEPDREQFTELLLKTIKYAGDRFRLILTVRADFVASCLAIPELSQILQQSSVLVPPYLTESDYRNVIVKPATQVGLKVEPSLIEVLLQELKGATGDLPLLQFVLQKLWENREGGLLTLRAYRQLGGIKGALEKQAQELYDSLDEETQECARWIFLNLTKIGDGTEDTRRRVTKSDLIVTKYPAELVEKTLQKLTAAKLILVNLDNGMNTATSRSGSNPPDYDKLLKEAMKQEATVEVVHEILIRHWSTLRWWLEENRSRLQLQRQIEQAAILWHKNNQHSDFLLRGVRLAEAEDIYIKYNDELTETAQEFIASCIEQKLEEERIIKRRLRSTQIAATVLGVLSIAAMSFASLAYRQKLITQIENIHSLNATSEALLLSNQQLESVVTSLQAGKQLKQIGSLGKQIVGETNWSATQVETAATLQQAIYGTQEFNILQGHSQKINALVYSSDGKLIATGSNDNTIKIWNQEGKLLDTLSGHKDAITSLAFAETVPENNNILQGNTIKENSYLLVSGSADKTLNLWRITNNQAKQIGQLIGHNDQITDVAINNNIIASASRDGKIKLWTEDSKLISTLSGHQGWVNTLQFLPDSSDLASGGEDGNIIIWKVNSNDGEPTNIISASQDSLVNLAVMKNNKSLIIAAISDYGETTFWNAIDGSKIQISLDSSHNEVINKIVLSPDSQLLAAATNNGINIYNRDGLLQQTLNGHNGQVLDVQFQPVTNQERANSNSYILASTGIDKTVKLWRIFQTSSLTEGGIYTIATSPLDPSIFATAGFDGNIRIWQYGKSNNNQELITTLSGHQSTINQLQYSPDGQIIASASADKTIKIWDITSGKLITTIQNQEASINTFVFDNSYQNKIKSIILGDTLGNIQIWKIENNQSIFLKEFKAHSDSIKTIALSHDNKLIASGGYDKNIKIWTKEGELLQTINAHNREITSLQFSPDQKNNRYILASSSGDNTIKLWTVNSSGKTNLIPLQILSGHQDIVTSLVFSQNGKILASSSSDRSIKLWNTNTGDLIKTLQGHVAKINTITLSNNDQSIISADEQQGLFWWNLAIDNLLKKGCDRISNYLEYNNNLNQEEKSVCQP